MSCLWSWWWPCSPKRRPLLRVRWGSSSSSGCACAKRGSPSGLPSLAESPAASLRIKAEGGDLFARVPVRRQQRVDFQKCFRSVLRLSFARCDVAIHARLGPITVALPAEPLDQRFQRAFGVPAKGRDTAQGTGPAPRRFRLKRRGRWSLGRKRRVQLAPPWAGWCSDDGEESSSRSRRGAAETGSAPVWLPPGRASVAFEVPGTARKLPSGGQCVFAAPGLTKPSK